MLIFFSLILMNYQKLTGLYPSELCSSDLNGLQKLEGLQLF